MIDILHTGLITIFLFAGVFFTLTSAIGLLRLPDVFSRSHLATETDTLGAGLTVAAVGLAMGWHSKTVIAGLLLVFIFIANPTAAHAIARAAYEEQNGDTK